MGTPFEADGPQDGADDAGDEAALAVSIGPAEAGLRLDKALALALAAAGEAGFSRSRLAQLIAEGHVRRSGATVTDTRRPVKPGDTYLILPPPAAPATPEPEPIPLAVAFEDAHLLVVDKPAGMVVHPAPGAERGTLVNALLHHCDAGLTGIGGIGRPGIVHRIDKDTSGLLVVAKTAEAHAGLARLFAAHDIERAYLALAWGAPDAADPRLTARAGVSAEAGGLLRIEAPLARHPVERKRMAVVPGGRRAVTRLAVLERFGPPGRALACLLECRLETGRTHQIRVHARAIGHPLIGDPLYGQPAPAALRASPAAGFARQALHAAVLGFRHPVTRAPLRFEAPLPQDLSDLLGYLRRIGTD